VIVPHGALIEKQNATLQEGGGWQKANGQMCLTNVKQAIFKLLILKR
jgi:hypothetical protein